MADEFGIFGSFGSGSTYNPFASTGLPSLNSTLAATGTTPVVTGTGGSAGSSSGTSSSSSGSSGWGGIIQDAFSTALSWGSNVLAFDLFGRAQDAGISTGTTQTTGSANTDTNTNLSDVGTSSGSMIAGVPSWLVYGGLGLLLLLVILNLMKG